ncbi:hypothetical protein DV736_g4399, partial [Chaetothyriales sp. CBS 134916]
MDLVDGSEHFQDKLTDQAPSLLTVILDTNPLAWALLEDILPLSSAVANLLVFINAHLASNYTNKVAVIASHCDKAQWLYPTPTAQLPRPQRPRKHQSGPDSNATSSATNGSLDTTNSPSPPSPSPALASSGNKYRPFRLIEAELITNLNALLSSTTPASLSPTTSTHVAGALTLALSYINRLAVLYNDSLLGPDPTLQPTTTNASSNTKTNNNDAAQLQSRILLVSVSPSTDLAHHRIAIAANIPAHGICGVAVDAGVPDAADGDRRGLPGSVLLPSADNRPGVCVQHLPKYLLRSSTRWDVFDVRELVAA